jgi:hypothetical protein
LLQPARATQTAAKIRIATGSIEAFLVRFMKIAFERPFYKGS